MIGVDFEQIVSLHYESLYKFAFSLVRSEADACDLTQQTFYIWATKGHQLRDAAKVKTWLFTTLHREFLRGQRRLRRHPLTELSQSEGELPTISPTMINELDAATVVQSLAQVEEPYQAPVALFYLESYSYKEIAEILEVPVGTVQSRIARGKAQLRQILLSRSLFERRKEIGKPLERHEGNWRRDAAGGDGGRPAIRSNFVLVSSMFAHQQD
jgi:RNA polymerase sigma-70 factor (ECF subfamily)